jgi:hypothetical protein
VKKYRGIMLQLLLLQKPKIYSYDTQFDRVKKWKVYGVNFSNNRGIHYNIGYMGNPENIMYEYVVIGEYLFAPIAKMKIV